ncbi:hypothetical protein QYE76_060915 [Lolium multiflorum]|uniref:Retrotransposon gag domain-containing protein n=1 Tax=Lolium multiflorum TaxID=4521 RepID=A0AAD8S287_LOLMU|nr:hypothetical protein QYE76_060915 [Lolium multiflorum]
MLQLYLVGLARIWLSDLEKNSIFCWFDLKNAFEKHFRGTYKRPATTSDVQACIQKKGETSRSFLTRWSATRNECENVDNRTAMHTFIGGLQRGRLLRHKLTCLVNANKLTLDDMITIASDHTAADDDAGGDLTATAIPLNQQKKNRDNGSSSGTKRKNPPDDQKSGGSDLIAMAFQRGGQGGGAGRGQQCGDEVTTARTRAPQTYEEYRDMPCLAHIDPAIGKSSHTNRASGSMTSKRPGSRIQASPHSKGGKGKNKDKEEDSSEAMDEDEASPDAKEGPAANKSNPFVKKSAGAYHTFLGTPTVRASKSALRILNATVPAVPQYVRWSETPCTFDRQDHPTIIPKECYALVVSPRIDGIRLPVAFGDVNNFREEMITFEVVPFKSSYHVIFGRPTYHKFHARACYIYNKLKIPGPNESLTGVRILLEKAPSECNISEDQQLTEITLKILFFQKTKPAKGGRRAAMGPIGRRGPCPGRAAWWGGGPAPSAASLRVLLRRNLSSNNREETRPLRGKTLERKELSGRLRGNSLPEGEIDAIVTVIELDIIGIIITIISIIITAISTAAPRHRCNI